MTYIAISRAMRAEAKKAREALAAQPALVPVPVQSTDPIAAARARMAHAVVETITKARR